MKRNQPQKTLRSQTSKVKMRFKALCFEAIFHKKHCYRWNNLLRFGHLFLSIFRFHRIESRLCFLLMHTNIIF